MGKLWHRWNCLIFTSLASGYASKHIVCRSLNLEIGRVATGRASGVKIPWIEWLDLRIQNYPSIHHLFKQSKQTYKTSKSVKTYNIGLNAKAHVVLLDCLHVAHENNTKITMIYS